MKADIFLIKLDPTFTLVFFGIKKLQSSEKVGPEVFGTGVCGNLLPKNGYKMMINYLSSSNLPVVHQI